MRHSQTSQRWSEYVCLLPAWSCLQRYGHRGMGTKACRARDKEALLGRNGEMSSTPSHPRLSPLPRRQSWHLHTLWEAPPQSTSLKGTPSGPTDPPRPQSTWFPRVPSPAGGSAGRPPNARLPWRVAAQKGGREEKGRERRGLKRQCSSPSLYSTHKNPCFCFHPPLLCFPLQLRRRPPKLPASLPHVSKPQPAHQVSNEL